MADINVDKFNQQISDIWKAFEEIRSDFTSRPELKKREVDVNTAIWRQMANAAEANIITEFKKHLISEFNLGDNSKADLLFTKAWEHGHADGLSAVYEWFKDLYELVK